MKRSIAFLMALVMSLSLCACGESAATSKNTEELIASTPFLHLDELWSAIETNKANAKLTYDKKMFQVRAPVMNIETNFFVYRVNFNGYVRSLEIYMPTETLAALSTDSYITVLGKLVFKGDYVCLKNAFVVEESMVKVKTFDDETVQNAIDDYTAIEDGVITWKGGSCQFFIDNRWYFEKLTADTFFNEMEGKWFGKYYRPEAIRQIVFTSNSTADVSTKEGTVNEWKYGFDGDLLKFSAIADENYEIRKVSDRLVVFYEHTPGIPLGDYAPYLILYKE